MRRKTITLWSVVAILVIGGAVLTVGTRAGTESARYKVLKKDGKIEIRQYADHVVAVTSMSGSGENGSFGKLFRYISGDNADSEKIAMTTPVFMPATSDGKAREMQFVVPASVAQQGAPAPTSGSVKLKRMSGGEYAAIRYSGRSSSSQQKKKLAELRDYLSARGIAATGNPIFAGYDPPWTPALVRRNEVLLRVN